MQIMNWFVISHFARRLRPDIKIDMRDANRDSAKKLYGYGSANVISGLGDLLLFRTGEVLAAIFIGPAAVTYYAIAGTLLEYLQKLVFTMASTLHPFSSAKQASGDERSLQAVALVGTKLSFLIALPVIAGIVIFGHEFIAAWMGASYADLAGPLLMAMALGRLFWIAQSGTFQILLGAGRHQQAMIINVLTGVLSFLGGLIAIQKHGLVGMTIGAAIPVIVMHGIVTPVYAMRTLKIPFTRYLVNRCCGRWPPACPSCWRCWRSSTGSRRSRCGPSHWRASPPRRCWCCRLTTSRSTVKTACATCTASFRRRDPKPRDDAIADPDEVADQCRLRARRARKAVL